MSASAGKDGGAVGAGEGGVELAEARAHMAPNARKEAFLAKHKAALREGGEGAADGAAGERAEHVRELVAALEACGEPDGTWKGRDIPEAEGMVIAHRAVRLDLRSLQKACAVFPKTAAELQGGNSWKVKQTMAWFRDVFMPHLESHHENEEKVAMPALKAAGAPIPAKVSADHREMMFCMYGIGQRLETLAQKATGRDHKAFAGHEGKPHAYRLDSDAGVEEAVGDLIREVNYVVDLMMDHLEEEEVVLGALVHKYMSRAQYDAMTDVIARHEQEHGGLRGLAWFLFAAGDGPEVRDIRAHLPCFLTCLMDCCILTSYRNTERRLIESVYDPSIARPAE